MPIFALANAGVVVEGRALEDPLALRVSLGVALGLLAGKPVGITLFAWIAVRLRLAELPSGVDWRSLFGAALLAGIGFTMALFVTALAFDDPAHAAASKAGVMLGSLLATLLGISVLALALPRADRRSSP
jgi:NhaA family Na+:H+ antiporter